MASVAALTALFLFFVKMIFSAKKLSLYLEFIFFACCPILAFLLFILLFFGSQQELPGGRALPG